MPLQLEIVTPERLAYSDTVDSVQLPGSEGELGVLPHHAPLISTLGVGELRIRKGGQEESFAIVGGFLQVRPDKVVVLAETADMSSEIDLEKAQEARREAEKALESGYHEGADLAAARAALQQALLRIRVAERRYREGPRHAVSGRRWLTRGRFIGSTCRARDPGGLPGRGRAAAVRVGGHQRRQERRSQDAGRGHPDRRALPDHERARDRGRAGHGADAHRDRRRGRPSRGQRLRGRRRRCRVAVRAARGRCQDARLVHAPRPFAGALRSRDHQQPGRRSDRSATGQPARRSDARTRCPDRVPQRLLLRHRTRSAAWRGGPLSLRVGHGHGERDARGDPGRRPHGDPPRRPGTRGRRPHLVPAKDGRG